MDVTIGVDVGGTKILAGVVDTSGRILQTARRSTAKHDAHQVLEQVADVVAELRTTNYVVGVGVGIAGGIDQHRSHVYFAPNLGWEQVPARAILEQACGLPVVVENDGNAAAWAEARFGAGRGCTDFVMVTVGTGIGGGVILGGAVMRGAHGAASEIGHITTVPDGRPCGCGRKGCWEQYASGNALVREARALAAEHRTEATFLLSLGDGTPEGVQGEHVTEAAAAGDPVAVRAFAVIGTWLGRGLADLTAVLDPQMFVIGGGVADAGDLLTHHVRAVLDYDVVGLPYRPLPLVTLAEMGNKAGLIGAADLARVP